MTLRARLLLGLVALAAIGLAVAGGVTYHQERQFLTDRVDSELKTSAQNQGLFFGQLGPTTDQDNSRGVPVGTYAKLIDSSGNTVNEIPTPGTPPVVPAVQIAKPPGQPFTVRAPHFRVLVEAVQIRSRLLVSNGTLIIGIPLRDVDDTLHHLLLVESVVALVVLLALAALSWFVVKLGLRPLEQMQQTAGAIAAGDLSQRIETADEHTEVGRLGLALNEMLHQIETAFGERSASEARLRRFIADASHELRTPLTSIRGYAELFRRGAAERPEDLAKAMRRIEEEANRMGVLVDDLLLLARLDQGRPLERKPVDLTRITRDAVDDARAVAPTRPIDYSPNGAIIVPGDEARLRQVLANLLQNADRHTPANTPVHVRVTSDDTDAVIEVVDEGPGMEQEAAGRVFERFWRSDPSRTRASGGAGLGLAIVAAIADAHGGRAAVDTTLGHGTTFRVRLPRELAEAEPS